jgi:mono/diheme cytochrome c family protein
MTVCSIAASLLLGSAGAHAGDAAAGQKIVAERCAECHEAADFAGEDANALVAMIKDIKDGKTKHKNKITLSDEEIASVAAYLASGGK